MSRIKSTPDCTTGRDLAEVWAGGFLDFAKDMQQCSLKDLVEKAQGENVLQLYEVAEACRIIFTNAYHVHHKMMTVANNVKIAD